MPSPSPQVFVNAENAQALSEGLVVLMEALGALARLGAALRNPAGDDLAVTCARQAAHVARVLGLNADGSPRTRPDRDGRVVDGVVIDASGSTSAGLTSTTVGANAANAPEPTPGVISNSNSKEHKP